MVATQTSITITTSVTVGARLDTENGAGRAAKVSGGALSDWLRSPVVDVPAEMPADPGRAGETNGNFVADAPRQANASVPSVEVQAQLLGQLLAQEEAWTRTAAKIAGLAYETIEPEFPVRAASGFFFLDRRKPVDVTI